LCDSNRRHRQGEQVQQQGSHRLPVPRDRVFAALVDPRVLEQCIEGCERLVQAGEHRYEMSVRAKVGPVQATFAGDVALHDLVAPERFRLVGSGRGGAAGFARGEATILLREDGTATELDYTLEASVGGKLAQVGSRLVDGVARRLAEHFFARFTAIVAATGAEVVAPGAGPEQAAVPPPSAAGAADLAGPAAATTPADMAAAGRSSSVHGDSGGSALEGERFAPSQQGFVWGVVFGVLLLALLLAAV
jgi:hypothetical protein